MPTELTDLKDGPETERPVAPVPNEPTELKKNETEETVAPVTTELTRPER